MRWFNIRGRKAKPRRPKRQLRALRRWAERHAGYFPVEFADMDSMNWKIGVGSDLVRPPTTTPELQAQCAQCLIDAAAHMARAKPPEFADARVVAIIPLPDMFGSEVRVFFDEGYFEYFTDRDTDDQRWTPLPENRSVIAEMGLRLPDGFAVIGFAETIDDEDEEGIREGEVWLIGECGPALST